MSISNCLCLSCCVTIYNVLVLIGPPMSQNEILQELIRGVAPDPAVLSSDDDLQRIADSVSLAEAEDLIDARVVPLQRELGVDLSTVCHH
jgi:hypothetical protein